MIDASFAMTFCGRGANWSAVANCWPAETAYLRNCFSAPGFEELRGTIAYVKVEIG